MSFFPLFSVLVLMDLSAAFDTVDHNMLLKRLENWASLSRTVLNWFKTYLENRKYFVSIGNFTLFLFFYFSLSEKYLRALRALRALATGVTCMLCNHSYED